MILFDKIKKSDYKNQVFDVLYLGLFQGFNHLIPLFIVPYLMYTLGAEKYGYIGLAFAFSQYFVLLINFGFGLSATKQVAIAYERKDLFLLNKTFFSTLYAKLILLVFSTILFFLLCLFIPQFKIYFISILCTYPLILGSAIEFSWFFQGIGKIRILSAINTIFKFTILPLTFVFVTEENDYNLAILIQSFVYLFTALFSILYIIKNKLITFVPVNRSDIKFAYQDSYPLFLSSVATSIYTQLFTVILAFFVSPLYVGRYSAAEKIMRSLCFLFYTPINLAFYPKLSSLVITNINEARCLFVKLYKFIFCIMFILFVFLFFGSPLTVYLGDSYNGIANILKIMSVAPIAIALGGLTGQIGLVAMGNQNTKKRFRNVYWIVAVLSLLYVMIFTYFFKEIGASIALVLTEYTVFVLMTYYYWREIR